LERLLVFGKAGTWEFVLLEILMVRGSKVVGSWGGQSVVGSMDRQSVLGSKVRR
jgi:hypothetical protein